MSPGDIIDEFGGHVLHNAPQGKVTYSIVTMVAIVIEMF